MRILSVRTYPITLTVKPAFYIVSSAGAHAVSRYIVLAIETDDGLVGWGEATVVPVWSGETQGGKKVPGSVAYPVGNGGSLFLVVLAGVLFFKEHVSPVGIAGIAVGISAVLVLVLS